ncbi:cell wall-binding repeat-containing protein [Peptostreptococcus equinus]|uniref:Cell wall-binding repeat-containing protein n=1 Tax=Peptostreptococcus equinus TaxID=3003601 RepID=A0ABY7JQ92_9FIRM|nr:cell wall-binding repeat-containing protein [Peptostreptococcus sp. CBA3647]WAW15520.1 cell wall-binding repeat-containing protein [Peptostreptococcus sp. CBA3647]
MKKIFKYILMFLALVIIYKGSGMILNKMYLKNYNRVQYTGDTRYDTLYSTILKKYKKSDEALLINVSYIDDAVSFSNYAYQKNIPIIYSDKTELDEKTEKIIKKLGVKKITIIGSDSSISNSVERNLNINDIKTERIIYKSGVEMSKKAFELTNKYKRINGIAIVSRSNFDLPNAISFAPYALNKNIAIVTTDQTLEDIINIKKIIEENKIENIYYISNNKGINENLISSLGKGVIINGKDRFEVNKNIINKFYANKSEQIYVSQAGKIMHRRYLDYGQLTNAMSALPLAAESNSPILFLEKEIPNKDEINIISRGKYKTINEMGFKIKRRKIFDIERFAKPTTILLVIISMFVIYRTLSKKDHNL